MCIRDSLGGVPHRLGHQHRVLSPGHRGGEHHRGAAQLHRQRDVGGGAGARVQDDRDARALHDQLEVVRVADAEAGADRRAQRHDRGAADVLQLAGQHRVVVGVRQHREAVVDQGLGGVQQLDRVRQEGPFVGDHLQLHPVGAECLAGQPGGQHGLAGGEAAGRVGEHADAVAGQHVQDGALGGGVDPAHRDGGQLGAGGEQRALQDLQARRAAGAHDQPGGEARPGDGQQVVSHLSLPARRSGSRSGRPPTAGCRTTNCAAPRPR